jgi:tetratricopeptide (TPR) repeat protein
MNLARKRFCSCCAALWFLLLVVGVGWGQTAPAGANSTSPQLKLAFAAWEKGEYAAAIAEFEKVIKQDPDNVTLHTEFVTRVVSSAGRKAGQLRVQHTAQLAKEETGKAKVVPGGKQAASTEQTQKAEPPTPGVDAALLPPAPPPKNSEELAKMEKDATDAQAAVAELQQLYERWAKENPTKALYPFELASFVDSDSKEIEKCEQYLLSAVALDGKFTAAYSELAKLYSRFDDRAAAEYAGKAFETKPGDAKLQLRYASLLQKVDPAAARKIYRDMISKNAGTQTGADALTAFINATEDDKEKVALIEQYRREYPDRWKPSAVFDRILFDAYVTTEPTKGLAFAQQILKGIESNKSEPNSATGSRNEGLKRFWKPSVDYAQALVQSRSLMADKKYADATALLEKTKIPHGMDETTLLLLKAEAADGAGGTAKAYEMIATPLLKAMDTSLQSALVEYGAKLGKSAEQVDRDLWSRRMQKADPFKEFDLKKLGADDRLKLADLRGKVVMVDFWFPT